MCLIKCSHVHTCRGFCLYRSLILPWISAITELLLECCRIERPQSSFSGINAWTMHAGINALKLCSTPIGQHLYVICILDRVNYVMSRTFIFPVPPHRLFIFSMHVDYKIKITRSMHGSGASERLVYSA